MDTFQCLVLLLADMQNIYFVTRMQSVKLCLAVKKKQKNTYIRKSLTTRDRGQRGFWQRMWDIVALYDVNLITIT